MKVIDRRKQALGGQSNDRPLSQIKKIVWHYTATLDGSIESHERYWKSTHGWDRGGYHYYIDRNGVIYWNYNHERITWGVANNNHNTVHISCEASTGNNYTQAQVDSRDWLTRKLMKELNRSHNDVLGHREVYNNSSCPGYSDAELRNFRLQLSKPKAVVAGKVNAKTHKVVQGDTLWAISKRYGVTVDQLKAINQLDSNLIVVGEELALTGTQHKPSKLKPLDEVAMDVINGNYGNYPERKKKLEAEGYNYNEVQAIIDRLVTYPKQLPLDAIARKVINGEYGNGDERKRKLQAEGYNYNEVQAAVNRQAADNIVKKTYVKLSPQVTSWRVYPLGKTPVIANAIGSLNPNKFGGLEYEVLGYQDVGTTAIIQTEVFGKVKIYLDGDATIYKK